MGVVGNCRLETSERFPETDERIVERGNDPGTAVGILEEEEEEEQQQWLVGLVVLVVLVVPVVIAEIGCGGLKLRFLLLVLLLLRRKRVRCVDEKARFLRELRA